MASTLDKQLFTEAFTSVNGITNSQRDILQKISYHYSWYVVPKLILMESYGQDSPLYKKMFDSVSLNLLSNSYFNLRNGLMNHFTNKKNEEDLIGKFLEKEPSSVKIVPNQVVDNVDVVGDSDDLNLLEEMAQRFVEMGLKREAVEIYRKLYLKVPEKSVYFAQIIESLNSSDR